MRSVNLGVGENGIHPQYADILDYLWSRAIKTSITSNGRSIAVLPDAAVRRFHSVEFSLDFPTEHEHDRVRGPGNWRTVMESLERCTGLGVPTTVTAVMMNTNYRRMGELAKVAAGLGANLRVNVYQPSKTDRFTLGYEQFWTGFETLFGSARLVATSEPVVAAVLGIQGFTGPGSGPRRLRRGSSSRAAASPGALEPDPYCPCFSFSLRRRNGCQRYCRRTLVRHISGVTHGDLGNRASPRLLRPFRDMTALWIDHYPRVLHACCTFTGLSPDAVGWDVEPQREFAEFFPADFRDPSAVDQAK